MADASPSPATFVVVVQEKVLAFGDGDDVHRDMKDEQLRSELATAAAGSGAEAMCQPGGGCVVLAGGVGVAAAVHGTSLCVFQGTLNNLEELSAAYGPIREDEPAQGPAHLTPAELVIHMYAKAGMELLAQLHGSFTFVLYESKMCRVLAARDGRGGHVPLWEARTRHGSLILATGTQPLEGCTELVALQPGFFKYGWHATPRLYQPAEPHKQGRRSLDVHGHGHAHTPHHPPLPPTAGAARRPSGAASNQGSPGSSPYQPQRGSRPGSRRASLDVPGGLAAASAVQQHHTYSVGAADPEVHEAEAGVAAAAATAGAGATAAGAGEADSAAAGEAAWVAVTGRRRSPAAHGVAASAGAAAASSKALLQPRPAGERRRSAGDSRPCKPGAPAEEHRTSGSGAPPPPRQQRQAQAAAAGKARDDAPKAAATAMGAGAAAASATHAPPATPSRLDVNAPEFRPRWVAAGAAAAAPAAALAPTAAAAAGGEQSH